MKSTTAKSYKIVTYFLFSGILVDHVERRGRRKGHKIGGEWGEMYGWVCREERRGRNIIRLQSQK